MTFLPPKVDYRKPRVKTVLAFLQSKGWVLDRRDNRFFIMTPPGENKPEKAGGYRYYVPANESFHDYDESAFMMVEVFSEIFEIPMGELFGLLSKSLDEIKQEVEQYPRQIAMKKAILANAI